MLPTMQTAVRGIIAAIALVWLASPAHAQQANPKLTKAFECGIDAYNLGDYKKARECFEQARAIDPNADGVYRWLAAVSFAEANYEDCIANAREYLRRSSRGRYAPDIRKLHEQCREKLDRDTFAGDYGEGGGAVTVIARDPRDPGQRRGLDGCKISFDGIKSGATPLDPTPRVSGKKTARIECEGFLPVEVEVDILEGVVTDVVVDVEPDPNYKKPVVTDPNNEDVTTGWIIVQIDTPGTTVVFDGKPVEPDHTGKFESSVGTYVMEVCAPGYDCWRRRVRVVKGQKRLLAIKLKRTAQRRSERRMGYIFLGTAAAFAASGVVFGQMQHGALEEAQDWTDAERWRPSTLPLEQTCAIMACHTREEIEGRVDDAKKYGLISNLSFGAAAVALGVSVYYFVQERPAERAGYDLPLAIGPYGRDGIAATYTAELDW